MLGIRGIRDRDNTVLIWMILLFMPRLSLFTVLGDDEFTVLGDDDSERGDYEGFLSGL
jgi:beta-xylosidase